MSLEIRRVVRAAFLITSLTGNAGVWAAEGSSPPASPTFAGDIAPIIYTKCVSCHRPGEIAPMSFTSYEETRPWAKSIRKSVSERKMPPWKAEPGIGGPWLHDPSLSQEEIDTIARWVDQGAPAGDLAKAPPLPEFPKPGEWRLGEPDAVAVFEEITVPPESDGYWGPTTPITFPEGAWLQGIEIIPSNPAVAHHIVIYAGDYETMGATSRRDSEGKSYRDGVLNKPKDRKQNAAGAHAAPDAGIAGGAMLGARGAGGGAGALFSDGFGRPLPKADKLTGEFHFYNSTDKEQKCQVKVGLHYGRGELKKIVHLHAPANFNIYIEPGHEGVESRGYHVFDQDVYLTSMTPHFHILGRDMSYFAVYPDGKREELLRAHDLDFNWQTAYTFKEPKLLPKGTRVEYVGHWRDPATSPDHPVKKPVIYGAAAFDEMAFGIMTYYPAEGREEKNPNWTRRIKEYMEWFPDPNNYEGTAKGGMLGVPAVVTIAEGTSATLHIAMPGTIMGHGALEIQFKDASWDGKSFTAKTPPGGFFGGTVTMTGTMTQYGPEVSAIKFEDMAVDLGGITDMPWTFTTKAAQLAKASGG